MKNIILSLALLISISISAPLFADIRICSHFTREVIERSCTQSKQGRTQELNFDLEFKEVSDHSTIVIGRDSESKILYTILAVMDEGLILVVEWFEKNSQGEFKLVCNPTLTLKWDQEAVVFFGRKDTAGQKTESVSLAITAHENDNDDDNDDDDNDDDDHLRGVDIGLFDDSDEGEEK